MIDPPDPSDEDRKRQPPDKDAPDEDTPYEAEEVLPVDDDRPRPRSRPGDRPRPRDDRDEDRPRRRPPDSGPRPRDYDDDYDDDYDRPRRPRPYEPGAEQFLIPVNVSGWSIAACYVGLIGLCIPIFSIPALIFGIVALRSGRKKRADYGKVTSDIRAITGIIFSLISIVGWSIFVIFLIFVDKK